MATIVAPRPMRFTGGSSVLGGVNNNASYSVTSSPLTNRPPAPSRFMESTSSVVASAIVDDKRERETQPLGTINNSNSSINSNVGSGGRWTPKVTMSACDSPSCTMFESSRLDSAEIDEELQAIMMSRSSERNSTSTASSSSSLARNTYSAGDDSSQQDSEGVILPGVGGYREELCAEGEEGVVETVPPRPDHSHDVPHAVTRIPMANSPAITTSQQPSNDGSEVDDFTPYGGSCDDLFTAQSPQQQFFLCSVSPPHRSNNPPPQIYESGASLHSRNIPGSHLDHGTGSGIVGVELGLLSMSPPLPAPNTSFPRHSIMTGGGFLSPYCSSPMMFTSSQVLSTPPIPITPPTNNTNTSFNTSGSSSASPPQRRVIIPPQSPSPPHHSMYPSVSPPSTVSMWFL
ncbi:hypothetical protein Pelo_1028 [Pelomyxa schiedti]|nr:hypothetical protein Pelo_1028 [Pelomyxa schiedti]